MTWPISCNAVSVVLARQGLTPLRKYPVRITAKSAKREWMRYEVAFSIFAVDRLPILIDIRTGKDADGKVKVQKLIEAAFLEPLTDVVVRKEDDAYFAEFTLFVDSDRGQKAYEDRMKHELMSWQVWSTSF